MKRSIASRRCRIAVKLAPVSAARTRMLNQISMRKKAALCAQVTAWARPARPTVVLFEDETLLREVPPRRAGWAKRGTPARGPITGSNARRTVFGTLNPATGQRLLAVRPRNRGDDFRAFLTQVRAQYKRWDILMLLDQGSSHTAAPTQRLAAALRIELGWLPTACPELNPTELLWRDGKQRISANR